MIIGENEQVIEHYGVKGMKWGVRKDRRSGDYKSTKGLRGRNPKHLSDAELRKTTNRIRLEKEYARLSPTRTSRGRAAVGKLLSSLGKQVAAKVVEQAATAIAKNLVDGAINFEIDLDNLENN